MVGGGGGLFPAGADIGSQRQPSLFSQMMISTSPARPVTPWSLVRPALCAAGDAPAREETVAGVGVEVWGATTWMAAPLCTEAPSDCSAILTT